MLVDDPLRDGESETRATRACCVERLTEFFQVALEPRSVVEDLDGCQRALCPNNNLHGTASGGGVARKIGQRLAHPRGVHVRAAFAPHMELALDALSDLTRKLGEVRRLSLEFWATNEIKKVTRELFEAPGLCDDFVRLGSFRPIEHLDEQLSVPFQRREGVADLVGEHRRHLAKDRKSARIFRGVERFTSLTEHLAHRQGQENKEHHGEARGAQAETSITLQLGPERWDKLDGLGVLDAVAGSLAGPFAGPLPRRMWRWCSVRANDAGAALEAMVTAAVQLSFADGEVALSGALEPDVAKTLLVMLRQEERERLVGQRPRTECAERVKKLLGFSVVRRVHRATQSELSKRLARNEGERRRHHEQREDPNELRIAPLQRPTQREPLKPANPRATSGICPRSCHGAP